MQNILHQTDALIAISAEIEKELQDYGFPAEHIHRIPNGVDTDEFKLVYTRKQRGVSS